MHPSLSASEDVSFDASRKKNSSFKRWRARTPARTPETNKITYSIIPIDLPVVVIVALLPLKLHRLVLVLL